MKPRYKTRKLAGRAKGEGGRCGESAACEELGETKWADDADSDDADDDDEDDDDDDDDADDADDADGHYMAGMSPQGLIHRKTACEKASRGPAGEKPPKKLSEPAISRRVNIANQEEWSGQIPIPFMAVACMTRQHLLNEAWYHLQVPTSAQSQCDLALPSSQLAWLAQCLKTNTEPTGQEFTYTST